jgi:hypothetical protein
MFLYSIVFVFMKSRGWQPASYFYADLVITLTERS